MRVIKLLKAIKHFIVAFYEGLVEARQMQARSRVANNGWY